MKPPILLAAACTLLLARCCPAYGAQGPAACPQPAQLNSALGEAGSLLQAGSFSAAAASLGPYAACDPRAALLYAGALDASGSRPAAEQALEDANRAWPENTSLAASLARYRLAEGRAGEAADMLAHCRPDRSTPLRELEVFTTVYISAHQLPRAQAAAELAFAAYPAEPTLLLLANTLQLEGRYPDVVSLMEKHRAAYGGSAAFLITVAESEFDGSEFSLAERDLARASALEPGSYPAHYLLGNTLARLGKLNAAVGEYQAAIRITPGQARTFHQLALAQEGKGDNAGAQQSLARALELEPCYAAAFTESGKILLHDGEAARAADQLQAAVRCDHGFEQAWYLLTQAYARLGEKEQGAEAQRTWLALKNAHKLQPAPPAGP